jgi:hypothetical protein
MAKSQKEHTEESDTSSASTIKLTEKQKEWVKLVYSDDIPLSLTWEGRIAEVTRRLGYKIDENALVHGSRMHFALNIKAEAYWSMVMMYHNVCESIRSPEVPGEGKASNENSSYKVKIENSLKLKPVMDEIKRMSEDLFKKNAVAEADFNAGKLESEFGEGALEAALREVNNEGDAKKTKAGSRKEAE